MPRLGLILALIALLQGCAAPQTRALLNSPPAALPGHVLLSGVPFYPQRKYYCGPASLAMTLDYHGLDISQQALAKKVYVPKLKGTLQAEMLAATRSEGMLAYVVTPDLRHLLAEVAAGHPAIVLQNLAVQWYPDWHYAVVIGYNLTTKRIILNSGKKNHYHMPLTTFERTWARGKHWALIPLKPGELPVDDAPMRILAAALDLEDTGELHAAHETYAATARRWPGNFIARMGAGNTDYALGRVKPASAAFRTAAGIRPQSAEAFNNLAVSLSSLHCHRRAIRAARRAVKLNKAHNPAVRRTLTKVRKAARETRADHPLAACRAGNI